MRSDQDPGCTFLVFLVPFCSDSRRLREDVRIDRSVVTWNLFKKKLDEKSKGNGFPFESEFVRKYGNNSS